MRYKIITDSSSDLMTVCDVDFSNVPLKITTSDKEYIDDKTLNVSQMLADLEKYTGRSGSACPNVNDWLEAFGDAECIFCVTITSGLSGSYNSAAVAAKEYVEAHPTRSVYVVDSLSTGPESALLIEKLRECVLARKDFTNIVETIVAYKQRTHLIFALESLRNLANNGRVSTVVAKVAGILGIRVVGKASKVGTLEMTNKVRGAEKTLSAILKNMIANGFCGGAVRIHHCENPSAAESLKKSILDQYPQAQVRIAPTRGLCSFYAERGGLLVGYEGNAKE